MSKRELTRITINLPTGLLEKVDSFAKKNGLSRTTAIVILCTYQLDFLKFDMED